MVNLGQRLQTERKKRELSLEEIAIAIKIRPEFLSAIEKGEYHKLPSPAYAQGFVTNYASYLGLPKKETIALFRREFDEGKMLKVLPDSFSRQKNISHGTFRIRRTAVAIVLILVFLLGYLFLQYRSVFFSPPLNISTPHDHATVKQNLTVAGSTDPNAVVAVDGQLISVDDNGNFTTTLTLVPGTTQIQIVAKSKYGKTTEVDRTVVVR